MRGGTSTGNRGDRLLWALALVLALCAVQRLGDGFLRLVWLPTPPIDLEIRWREVRHWFAGQPVYSERYAVYPPGSYSILWPVLGWVDVTEARWLWGITTLGMLGWISWLVARESGTRTGAGLAVTALLPLAVYPARAVMVNGQLALHLLPALLAGLLLLDRRPPSWSRDLGGAALLLIALTKPTLTAPFMWLVTTVRGPLRPAAMIVLGYAGLTTLALAFQPGSALALVGRFVGGSVRDAARAAAQSHANLHSWIDALGLGWGHAPASLAALAALGWWMYRVRGSDLWVRIGVGGLVARFWTFHYRYDDILVLLPMVALLRMVARREPDEPLDHAAALMLALISLSLLIPARLFFPPWPWQALESAQTLIWLAALALLLHRGRDRGNVGRVVEHTNRHDCG